MARLPQPGGDDGAWGAILNDYLAVAHDTDGSLKAGSVVEGQLSSGVQTKLNTPTSVADGSISEAKLDSAVQAKLNSTASGGVASVNTRTGAVTLTSTDVGLGNVDNVADANKPVSAAAQSALNLKANTASLAAVATTGSYSDLTGKPIIPTVSDASSSTKGVVQLAGDLGGTAASPTVPGLSSKEPAVTAGTTGQYYRGDKTFQTLDKTAVGLANVDNTADANKPVSAATSTALASKQAASSDLSAIAAVAANNDDVLQRKAGAWTNRTPAQLKLDLGLTASDFGLGNVNNTADINKPVSTATQAALNLKADATTVGAKILLIANAAALPAGTPAGVIVVVQS